MSRAGLGGIETNANGSNLYVWNLFNRTLYQYTLDPANIATAPSLLATMTVDSIMASAGTSCINSVARPWGVKSHNNSLYVSVTCDASSSTDATQNANLTGAVYTTDLTTGGPISGAWSAAISPFFYGLPTCGPGGYATSTYGRWRSTNNGDQPQPLLGDQKSPRTANGRRRHGSQGVHSGLFCV